MSRKHFSGYFAQVWLADEKLGFDVPPRLTVALEAP